MNGAVLYGPRDVRFEEREVPKTIKPTGRITVAGMTKEVDFAPVDEHINERIDDAYRTKYQGSPYLKPMIGERARAATVRVVPREATK